MKGKVCGDFCEFTLDKGHFITGENVKPSDFQKTVMCRFDSCLKKLFSEL